MPRPRILVVDDNRGIVEIFLAYLSRKGFRLAWAHDGVTGLALAKVTRPDLVILNWQMPRMDGLRVLRELRADPATRDMKVIFTSGNLFVAERAREAGAQDFIEYPIAMPELGAKVDKALAA